MSRFAARWLVGFFAFVGFLSSAPRFAQATMVLPLDLKAMTAQSGQIFVGRCREVLTDLDENGIPSTYVRFDVVKGIKGATSGEQILVKHFGVRRPPLDVREGESAIVPMKTMTIGGAGYEEGRDYLLFLYPESSLGFTSPIGAGQGRFQISTDQAGLQTAVNPLNNRNLKAFTEGPTALDDLVRRVEGMVAHERAE